ncbi:MAG: hypothetical protein PHF18_13040 [Methanosarcina sp.]|uniref:hypothetical protein n=1 Tax=Methanosarcina sp. TaxID=2213 RepID=UPI002630BCD9|nr:hypothetical protein [Methanosarcina sp.]MDD3247755.1 hypothetical protein [Methanosarcina sp.]MDD4250355.1 hypothetical protein [Methanosarcina sp.]
MYEDTPLFYLYLTLAADSLEVMQEIRVMRKKEKVPLKEVLEKVTGPPSVQILKYIQSDKLVKLYTCLGFSIS